MPDEEILSSPVLEEPVWHFDGWGYVAHGHRFRYFEDMYDWFFPWYRMER